MTNTAANATPKTVPWNGTPSPEAVDALSNEGGLIVCATKVGYILMTTDAAGLERKFSAKSRKRNKPGVVLCANLDQLERLAQLNDEIRRLYQMHWDQDILLGCILPWKDDAIDLIPEGAGELVMDQRKTSCFVIRFGRPAEQIVEHFWKTEALVFASSANPSGKGNRGKVEYIGEAIEDEADCIVAANDYVESIQPGKSEDERHEQGVMVSLVDDEGRLVPEQKAQRSTEPCPILIRRGLDYDKIMVNLSAVFSSWNYRQGQYY